jgi:CBS domain-containing protein
MNLGTPDTDFPPESIELNGLNGLAAMTVADLMTHNVHAATPADRLEDLHSFMRMAGIRHMPVLVDGRLIGIVSDRDVDLAWSQGPDTPASAFMTRYTQWVFPDTTARDAAARILQDKIGCLPVVDHRGQLVGMVTTSDFVAVAYRALTIQLALAAVSS